MIEIVSGDLLSSKEKYIIHSCNCLTQNSAGIAKAIFDKFPYANTYKKRVRLTNGETVNADVPGTIEVLGDGIEQRFVINMFAQYYPGKSKFPESSLDGTAIRLKYFHKCLLRVAKIPDLESVAFPWRIGCNLGGGNWDHYLGTITNFAQYVKASQNTKVIIYRREDDD